MEENVTEDEEICLGPEEAKPENPSELQTIAEGAKRLKTEHSSNSTEASSLGSTENDVENSEAAGTSFPKPANSKSRNYRKSARSSEDSSSDSDENASLEVDALQPHTSTGSASTTAPAPRRKNLWFSNHEQANLSNTSSDDLDDSLSPFNDTESDDESVEIEDPPVLTKSKPKHNWFMVPEVLNRQIGTSSKFNSAELFQRRCYGSLHCVQRLELMYKLERHDGCVNSLNFHPNGSLLASGSDDLNVVIWDWPTGKDLLTFETKHKGNVFQSKFMNLSGDLHIVTSARDGQVRLHQVSQTEGLRSSRRLGIHRGATNKLALLKDQPHVVLSSGEDGCVYSHDVRDNKQVKLVTVQTLDDRKIALYSINSHPLDSHQFCVSGRNHVVRTYDQRKLSTVLNTYCPGHFKKKTDLIGLHVTCAIYNYNGTEILASYSDDDIYLFDVNTTSNNYVHCYQGHRNGATVKGVNFFGPKSEYVVSGSDCGNLYFWDKNTESIVQWMLADDSGVVNCLEPHPQLPIICTSGLDWDVKVWVPSNENEPNMPQLENTVRRNYRCRLAERINSASDINESQMLWMLWRHLTTTEQIQRYARTPRMGDVDDPADPDVALSEDSSSNLDSSENDEDFVRPLTCSPS